MSCPELPADSADRVERRCAELERLFAQCFYTTYTTRLRPAPDEPLYRPAGVPGGTAVIYYVQGGFASALHEVAHWCIAGPARRQQLDYGYWYVPDGRKAHEQRQFENVEVKPQALEWLFAVACRHRFHVSADNLTGDGAGGARFEAAVHAQVMAYCAGRDALPPRAVRFRHRLCEYYQTPFALRAADFDPGGF